MIANAHPLDLDSVISEHALTRMRSRHVSLRDVECALDYGRTYYSRDAVFSIIGRREIERNRDEINLEHLDGLHVVSSRSGDIITVYRNRDFRSKRFPNKLRRRKK